MKETHPDTKQPTWDELTSRSGLDVMQALLSGTFTGPSIATTLGFELVAVGDGSVTFEGTPADNALNVMGGLHGGWYGTLLDTCMGCAVMTKVPKGWYYTTLEYKVNLTRALPIGTRVEAIGTVDHAGRSTGVATGIIRGVEDGRLYATGNTTCLMIPVPPLT